MRVCIVYDCLFPHTVGGAERWYRNLAERLAGDGHDVTYLTLRQWRRGTDPGVPGVDVVAVGPPMALYDGPGHRRILPPLLFGAGVFIHLLRHRRRYDVVHTASFPYFSLLAAGLVRPLAGYDLFADWHEVWSREYWREYLGGVAGEIGYRVQRLCARVPQRAFCFSHLHGARLKQEGLRGEVTLLPGEYAGPRESHVPRETEPVVLFAGRHIPEKQVLTIPPAIVLARQEASELRAVILGDGPDRARLMRLVAKLGLQNEVSAPGFVSAEEVHRQMGAALCLLLPSRREGYGMVVIEAASQGTPSIVVAAPDNAATELVVEGENGVVAGSAEPAELARAIAAVRAGGRELRERTARWFAANVERLSLDHSLTIVHEAYERERSARS